MIWDKNKTIKIGIGFLTIGVLSFFGIVLFVGFITPIQDGKVLNAKRCLKVARDSVEWFRGETSRLPPSLEIIHQYALEKNVDFHKPGESVGKIEIFIPDVHKERISCSGGNSSEYDILNNRGGFYYNNQTGEVKINLTSPLKTYFLLYYGEDGDEIPADW